MANNAYDRLPDDYGVFKQFCSNNHYVSLAKTLSSAVSTRDTAATMKRITHASNTYGHMGQLLIRDGVCYASFLQNSGSDGESHSSTTSEVVLAVFPLARVQAEDFDPDRDVVIRRLGGLGDSFAGQNASSIFKDKSMCFVGDELYILFSFVAEDGKSHMFRVKYDIRTGTFSEETMLQLSYKGVLYDFTDETLNLIYRDKGVLPNAKGLIELVSKWSEYNGEYYATGVTIELENNGFIVKTTDFKTMTLVDVPLFNTHGAAEIASYIFRDKLYVACRQNYGIPYLYLNAYDLQKGTWGREYKVPDGNVRPWFYSDGKDLYLMHTVEEYVRRYTNISRVLYCNFLGACSPIETIATLYDCGSYFAVCEYEGKPYFVCTKDTISFGELKIRSYPPKEVNDKLMRLLEL